MSEQKFDICIDKGRYIIKQEINDWYKTVYYLQINRESDLREIYHSCKTIIINGIGDTDQLDIQATSNVQLYKTKLGAVSIYNRDALWSSSRIKVPLFYIDEFIRVLEEYLLSRRDVI